MSDTGDIRAILDRYHAGVNFRDVGLLAGAFAEDAVWEIGPPIGFRYDGHEAVMAGLAESMGRQDLLVQSCSGVAIDVTGPDVATARSTLTEIGREVDGGRTWMGILHNFDEMRRMPEGWKIRHRRGVLVYEGDIALPGQFFGTTGDSRSSA